ncbi:MAG: cobalamin-binding protein [Thermoplasmata archaeon]|nr:cobalamin-binding protein [Thermoplasmata archaeon]MCI4353898.1 cobalamin-binding protein [Thermoplasmata archaeon]
MRVVSLLPSATEIVHDLGAGATLVGRSEECDFPDEVRGLPIVMRARAFDGDRPSGEIDERVREVRGSGESLYELDLDQLRTLGPEVVLTQDLCGVCSVTDADVQTACRVSGIAPQIVTLGPRTLEEVWDSIEVVGSAVGRSADAHALAERLRLRTTDRGPVEGSPSPVVAVVEWLDPPILAGLWTPDIVRAAGGTALGLEPGAPGLRTTWSAIRSAAPDLVVLSPCSFRVERTRRELDRSPLRSELARWRPPLGFWIADEAYFSRPGPRLADGVDLIRSLLSGREPRGPMPCARWAPE